MLVKSSIMVTGSRDIEREQARTLFEQYLSPFLSEGRTWLVGTAHGIDQWAMQWLSKNLYPAGNMEHLLVLSEGEKSGRACQPLERHALSCSGHCPHPSNREDRRIHPLPGWVAC
jgi:hypothetical protein